MYKIRKIKYSENSTSVQVYKIENRKRVIVRHIGTARSVQELTNLISLANDFIETSTRQLFLFNDAQLIAKYEFKELEAAKAQKLSSKLGFGLNVNSPMLLTAIYNQDEKEYQNKKNFKSVGFKISA